MFDEVIRALLQQLWGVLPVLAPLTVGVLVLATPMPGRGPRFLQSRDTWRGFKYAARRAVFERAGGRCEAGAFLAWGRCSDPATEADHVYPWSRRGPTVVSNGQALCRGHNRSKSDMRPPWWYVRGLERRRVAYFPAGASPRVLARMTEEDRAARAVPTRRARR